MQASCEVSIFVNYTILNSNKFATEFCVAFNHAVLHVYIIKLQD